MLGLTFIAAMEAAAATKPTHRALNGSAVSPQSGGGLDAPAGDTRHDVTAAEPSAQVVVVVAPIRMEFGGPTSPGSATGADRRDPAHEGFKSEAVVGVRGGDADRQGRTGPIGDQVDL